MKTLSHWDFLWCKGLHDVEYFVFLRKCLNEKIIEILWNYPNILSIFPSFLVLLSCLNTFFQLDVIISPGREEGICLHLWGTAQQQCMAAWFFLSNILVFCFQNCSDLLWEKKMFCDREKLLKFEADGLFKQWKVFETECFFNLLLEISQILYMY